MPPFEPSARAPLSTRVAHFPPAHTALSAPNPPFSVPSDPPAPSYMISVMPPPEAPASASAALASNLAVGPHPHPHPPFESVFPAAAPHADSAAASLPAAGALECGAGDRCTEPALFLAALHNDELYTPSVASVAAFPPARPVAAAAASEKKAPCIEQQPLLHSRRTRRRANDLGTCFVRILTALLR